MKKKIIIILAVATILCAFSVVLISVIIPRSESAVKSAAIVNVVDKIPITTPEPAAEPTPEPTPEPASIVFEENKELHLPNEEEELQYGRLFNLRGSVISKYPLKSVSVSIIGDNNEEISSTQVSFSENENIGEYKLEDSKSTLEGKSINDMVSFGTLEPGEYTFILSAKNEKAEIELVSNGFKVVKNEWLQLTSNCFRNNYSYALDFFGEKEKFMFKYKWADGRAITTDPEWVKKNITTIKGVNGGKKWNVNIYAVPYFEQALEYMNNTYIRVKSEGHDSGVIKLSEAIKTYNGLYNSRFVSDKTFVSHHAFGTAVDINANTAPYGNSIENRNVIYDEVANHLTYNGIMEKDGKQYYDFTYDGNWEKYYNGIPESLLNYLLYELAFYRAGFGWGYYYSHTCDGMHFTLSEMNSSVHTDSEFALRKVKKYIE